MTVGSVSGTGCSCSPWLRVMVRENVFSEVSWRYRRKGSGGHGGELLTLGGRGLVH